MPTMKTFVTWPTLWAMLIVHCTECGCTAGLLSVRTHQISSSPTLCQLRTRVAFACLICRTSNSFKCFEPSPSISPSSELPISIYADKRQTNRFNYCWFKHWLKRINLCNQFQNALFIFQQQSLGTGGYPMTCPGSPPATGGGGTIVWRERRGVLMRKIAKCDEWGREEGEREH